MGDAPRPKKDDGTFWCSFDECPCWDGYCSVTHYRCKRSDDPVLCGGIAVHFEKQIEAYQMHLRDRLLVDATPDEELPLRILEAYIDHSETTDNLLGLPPENPLIQRMEEARKERNVILSNAMTCVRFFEKDKS